jgi:D-3-phosphoglycerate dehydrogenase
MHKILIADKLPQASIDMLKEAGFEVLNQPGLDATELTQKLCQVDGVICRSGAKLTEDVLQKTETLKAICRAGVGVDNIDIPAATRKGIVVMNTPGANTISTAEHTIALILALARNIGPAYISMREGKWDRKKFTGMELAQNTLGIVGLGRVGQAVAKRALAFEMDIIAYDPFISEQVASKLGIKLIDSLDVLLKECDYLTIHVPANEKTKGLLVKEKIALMKPTARIVNCARGEVIDQEAVVRKTLISPWIIAFSLPRTLVLPLRLHR